MFLNQAVDRGGWCPSSPPTSFTDNCGVKWEWGGEKWHPRLFLAECKLKLIHIAHLLKTFILNYRVVAFCAKQFQFDSQSTQAEIKMDYLANLHSWTDNLYSLSCILTKFISEPIVLRKSYGVKLDIMTYNVHSCPLDSKGREGNSAACNCDILQQRLE